MKKHVLVFGLIPGIIWIGIMIIMVNVMYSNPDIKTYDVLGIALMLVVFSLIFFGIRDYRNKKLDGYISVGHALKAGTLMSLTATAAYVGIWMFYYYLFVPDFLDIYEDFVLRKTAPEDIAAQTEYLEKIRTLAGTPPGLALMTALEVLPMGLIVTLISAFVLKKKKNETHDETH